MVALNHAVAVGHGATAARRPRAAATLTTDERIAGDHRLSRGRARTCWRWPAITRAPRRRTWKRLERANSLPQQRYLYARAERLRER